MAGERGQASVEWVALVLLLALGLVALGRLVPSGEGSSLGGALVHRLFADPARAPVRTVLARGGHPADPARGGRPEDRARGGQPEDPARDPAARGRRLVAVPPLVPVPPAWGLPPPGGERLAREPLGRGRPYPRPRRRLRLPPLVVRRTRRAARLAWRAAWLVCLGYERARYGVLHPEVRYPGQTIPTAERLRIANDCLSPVDLVRDFGPIPGS